MSEFKFACPNCQQRIAAEATWSGQQIPCPACKAQITVPGAPADSAHAPAPPAPPPKGRLSVTAHAPEAPAPKPLSAFQAGGPVPTRKTAGSSAGKTAGIVVVSILVVVGAAFAVVKFRAKNAEAAAKSAAAASAAAETAAALAATNSPASEASTAATAAVASPDPSTSSPAVSAATRRAVSEAEARYGKSTQPASPGDDGVAPDPSLIPATPVAGTVQNEPFKITSATYLAGWLTLGEGSGAIPERSVKFNLYVPSTETIEGRTFKRPDPKERRPLTVQPKGKRAAPTSFTSGYALQMEFGKKQGNQIPGKLYLSIPGTATNQIAGTFKVELK